MTGMRLGILVLVVGSAVAAIGAAHGSELSPSNPAVLAQASPPAAPAAPSAARDAIDALKAAGATLSGPQSTQEYNSRVETARSKVKQYLDAADAGTPPVKDAVRASLHYHDMVAKAITVRMTTAEYTALGRDPAIEQCARLKEFLANFEKPRTQTGPLSDDEAKNRGIAVIGFGLGAVLACASDKAGEAERLLEAKP
jgi:hypothetical protein